MSLGGEIAGALVHADVVGRSGAGRVPHARGSLEQDHVLAGIERGLGGPGMAAAFVVGEIAGLLHGRQAARLGIEARQQIAAGGDGERAVALAFVGGGLGPGGDVAGAERFDAVLRAVGDEEVVAIERAVVLGGQVGEKLQDAGRMRDHGFDFAAAGAHLHFHILAAQHVGLAELPAGGGQRLGSHQAVSEGGHVRKIALACSGLRNPSPRGRR